MRNSQWSACKHVWKESAFFRDRHCKSIFFVQICSAYTSYGISCLSPKVKKRKKFAKQYVPENDQKLQNPGGGGTWPDFRRGRAIEVSKTYPLLIPTFPKCIPDFIPILQTYRPDLIPSFQKYVPNLIPICQKCIDTVPYTKIIKISTIPIPKLRELIPFPMARPHTQIYIVPLSPSSKHCNQMQHNAIIKVKWGCVWFSFSAWPRLWLT